MEVNVHDAKTNLSRLISAAESGEEVIIARNGKPAVKLVAVSPRQTSRKNLIGSGIGKIWIAPDFDSPETKQEILEMFESGEDFL